MTTCQPLQDAIEGAEVITTCTAGKQYAMTLTNSPVGTGVHFNSVNGDCLGKTELHGDILSWSDVLVE